MKNTSMARLGPALVLAAGILWGMVGIFTRVLNQMGFNAVHNSMFRAIVAMIIIVAYMLIKHPDAMKLKSIKHIGYFLISGTFGLAVCYASYFMTIQSSSLSVAVILLYSGPVMATAMATVIFKEKMTTRKVFSIICAFAGCFIMSGILGGGASAMSLKGLGIGLLSGLGYALYSVGSRMALEHYDTFAVTAYTFIFVVIGLLPVIWGTGTLSTIAAHPTSILLALGMGILCTLIPYTIYVLALNYVEVGKAAVLSYIEPLAATVLGITIFHEAITVTSVVAIILILMSVLVVNVSFGKKDNNELAGE